DFELLDNLVKKAFITEKNKTPFVDLLSCQKKYIETCRTFFELGDNGKNDSVLYYFRYKIIPLSQSLQNYLETFLKNNNDRLLEISSTYTREHKNKGLLFLTIGITPFVLLVVYLVFISLLLAYFTFFIYREKKNKRNEALS